MSVLIQTKADEFVSREEAFTSVDIANAIKTDGTWVRNIEVAEWLRQNFNTGDYEKSPITVDSGKQATLYHPEWFDIVSYDKINQSAMTPDEFNSMHTKKTPPTQKKKVAASLTDILDSTRMQIILDRSQSIQPVIDEILKHWSYDLLTRKPGAAYTDDGIFVGTDLDLSCFLFALADRGAIINIPTYEGRRPTQVTAGEIITSKDNRHGAILGVSANKENFSFSVRMRDGNVVSMTNDNFRNFMLIDVDGTWYDGWKEIQFIPDAQENDFLTNNSLWSGNTVVFSNFVHPNRWVSFYGQHYFATKALIDRLTEEAKYLKDVAKSMRDRGIIIGGTGGEKKVWAKKTVVGDQKSIKVHAFEAEIEHPEVTGIYPNPVSGMLPDYTGTTDSELLKATEGRTRSLTYTLIPRLRFATRATEYAFYLNSENGKKMPAWIQNAVWDRKYVLPRKKKVWNRLVFKRGIALRYRTYEKSEIVSA